jgi:EAL domain-containing protein (putative c-di-GMP-specific phosphodiesterase class I)/AmiR/NasT family two-component response regulator
MLMARILAVDDDPLVRRCMSRILVNAGHEVVPASHGADALQLASDKAFDVALVDYQLPFLDGLEVLQRLREVQPGCLRILVTGALDLPMIMDAVNRGEVMRVVEKPFESAGLVGAIDDAIAARTRMMEVCRVQEQAASEHEREMFQECLDDNHLRLALQPIIQATTSEILAFECLLRSTHKGLDGPLPLLHAAERHGMLPELARVVSERAADWMHRLPLNISLFMNLHPDELAHPDGVCERLEPLTPWANRVVLEITERSRLQGIEAWEESVDRVTQMGFSIAVDDLGAGYSSLSVLAELQPKYIKVDMSIVRGIDSEPRKQRLVDLLCRFAEATDSYIIAEGVETPEEAEALRACGAHMLQGYLFGRPSLELPPSISEAI